MKKDWKILIVGAVIVSALVVGNAHCLPQSFDSGPRSNEQPAMVTCANCGHPMMGGYCTNCFWAPEPPEEEEEVEPEEDSKLLCIIRGLRIVWNPPW